MKKRNIYITKFDKERLENLVSEGLKQRTETEYLRNLKSELERAKIVDPHKIPSDVITMNSKVRLKEVDSDDEMVIELVFPKYADVDQDKISILAPIGTALIGYRVGDTVEWPVPKGTVKLTVEEILYQPEREGDFEH
ncbi:nucleoside diphosphate kinase regulator [Chitinispirillales bacterium ANBcel5]|uniref:nucleoside diphosphate kinase regulator n=1 Tax=Cellulosispirillum alkaliphilum TaxID=3039283 RepID=UPI002A51E763|nr:nucleoside diphosphate kinase regulator [Chitinispirillales bacterium ANBcel5]